MHGIFSYMFGSFLFVLVNIPAPLYTQMLPCMVYKLNIFIYILTLDEKLLHEQGEL